MLCLAQHRLTTKKFRGYFMDQGCLYSRQSFQIVPGGSRSSGGIINTVKRQIFDVSGAGDTMIAMLTVAICNGLNIQDAIRLANLSYI